MMKLYKLFMEKDAVLLEINPLTEGADGKIYCSLFRLHPIVLRQQMSSLPSRYGLQDQYRR
jgi:hypothetical protein